MNVCRLRLTVPPDEVSQPEQGPKETERKKSVSFNNKSQILYECKQCPPQMLILVFWQPEVHSF